MKWRITALGLIVLSVLDVGQGDAIFVRTPDNVSVLVDGGPGDNILQSLGPVTGFFNRKIDLLILTHPDADHLEGLIPVLRRFKVKAVLRTDSVKESAAFAKFEELIRQNNVQDIKIYQGDIVKLGAASDLYVLWPPRGELNQSKPNESSLVAELAHGNYEFLLTGDIGSATESKILASVKPEFIEAEVIKVAHHGSKYSSSLPFLQLARPRVAAVSAGQNNLYGHPTPEVLARLQEVGAQILRTDLSGSIKFLIGGRGLVVTPTR